jgi:tetratricopeptide (TPR) repeat protein
MSPQLVLQLDRERYSPGDAVRGTIFVAEGGRSRSLQATLEYREETDDCLTVATTVPGPALNMGDLTTGTFFEFERRIPADAFPSYKSKHGELYWELYVKSDERGLDTEEWCRVEVVPAHAEPATEHNEGDRAFELGLQLEEDGDMEGAEAAYRRADERGHADGSVGLAVLLAERDDLQGAERASRRADELGSAVGASNVGLLLEEQGDLEGAEAAYRRADGRGGAEGAEYLGRLLEARGDIEGAEAAYARAAERRSAYE